MFGLSKHLHTIVVPLLTSIYLATFLVVLAESKKRKDLKSNKFKKILIHGITNNTITTFCDLLNFYRGIYGSSYEISHLVRLLRESFVVISTNLCSQGANPETSSAYEIKKTISDFISEAEKQHPFSILPSAERNILEDIDSFCKSGNSDDVERKLTELANLIKLKEINFEKIEKSNRWSIPLALAGLFFTLVFGLAPLIMPLFNTNSSEVKNDLDNEQSSALNEKTWSNVVENTQQREH